MDNSACVDFLRRLIRVPSLPGEEGHVVRAPKDQAFDAAFKQASSHGVASEGLVRIPQLTPASRRIVQRQRWLLKW